MMLHHKGFTSLSFFEIVTSVLSSQSKPIGAHLNWPYWYHKLVGPQRAAGGGILEENIPKRMVILCNVDPGLMNPMVV